MWLINLTMTIQLAMPMGGMWDLKATLDRETRWMGIMVTARAEAWDGVQIHEKQAGAPTNLFFIYLNKKHYLVPAGKEIMTAIPLPEMDLLKIWNDLCLSIEPPIHLLAFHFPTDKPSLLYMISVLYWWMFYVLCAMLLFFPRNGLSSLTAEGGKYAR